MAADIKIEYQGGPGEIDEHQLAVLDDMQFLAFDAHHVKPHQNHWWLATDRETGENAGFCCLYIFPGRHDTAFLSLAAVVRKYRGQGIQRKMIQTRVRKAKQLGCHRIITYTCPANTASANNLVTCGFRLYVPDYAWGLHDGIYFRKYL